MPFAPLCRPVTDRADGPAAGARSALRQLGGAALLALVVGGALAGGALAQTPAALTPYAQSVAAAAAKDEALAAWYRQTGYAQVWTAPDQAPRRAALFAMLDTAGDHGLPVARYDADGLRRMLAEARTEGDMGRADVALSRAYLSWADDMAAGVLDPASVDSTIVREIAHPDPMAMMRMLVSGDAATVMRGFVPTSAVYAQLMKARLDLEGAMVRGAWGATVPGGGLKPGDTGANVIALRDRMVAMGYMARSASASYDRRLQAAVQAFQLAHGLPADGVAGGDTLAEINKTPEDRLKSVTVAMERERWMDIDRAGRIIWVNLPDFTAKIVDDGRTVFRTRSVIGREDMDRRTPEFSDNMQHMVVNPSWGVPRSIIVGEYLPLLQRNPNAVSHFQIIDRNGRVIPRGSVNFAAYSARTFPFGMRQPPSDSNALGLVKFMFPNKYNIYLHDTPAKALFAHDKRAYSHGCIRLADPFEFAHVLFATQSDAVEEEFNATLKTKQETTVKLDKTVPIHLVYFTAYPEAKGRMGYRRDVYGRDARLWDALVQAGVELGPVTQ